MMKMQGCMTKSAEIMTAMNQYAFFLSFVLIPSLQVDLPKSRFAQACQYQRDQGDDAEHGQGDGARKLCGADISFYFPIRLACRAAQEYVTSGPSLGDRLFVN
jgi:hypothetical protein